LVDEKRAKQETVDTERRMEEAVQQKMTEVRKACQILGFDDVRTLGFDDDEILLTREMVEAVADVIRDVLPDVMITHHPYEMGGFKLHATTGQAVLYGWQQAAGTGRGRKRSHCVSSIFFMNPTGYMGHNSLQYASTSRVDVLVDVTDVIDKKVQAMDMISSQYYGGAYARKVHETSDGRYGQWGQIAYAESFQSYLARVCYTLPISDADLHRQNEPSSEVIARRGEIVAGLMPLPDRQAYTSAHRIPKEMYDA
jgi:LmbE family N-acetylglucosaminyl deacetylase